MVAPVAYRLLLGLLCLNECSRPQFQSVAGDSIKCLKMKNYIKQGSIVTTRQYKDKTWCGQAKGKFLAVTKERLFYLQCASGYPTQPKGAIYELTNLTGTNPLIFEDGDLCDISANQLKTGGKANILAQKLEGKPLPYDSNYCNALHYITYLSEGQVNTNEIMESCPLFNPFDIHTHIDTFKLADRSSYPTLTKSGLRKVQPISTGRNNSSTTSGTTTRTSWVSRLWSQPSRRNNSRKAFNVASKKGGGGGHASGGGGHAGGEGSHGGGESGGEGSPTRTVPRGRAGGTQLQTSGAVRAIQAPLFGVRLPSFGSSYYNPSAYPALGYGSYT